METPQGDKLLKKIQQLELGHAVLKHEISRLKQSGGGESNRPQRFKHLMQIESGSGGGGGGRTENSRPAADHLTSRQYLNILQSLEQSVYIYDLSGRVFYWNRGAEKLHGYSEAEALGQDIIKLLVNPRDQAVALKIIDRVKIGERWTGQFPIRSKTGEVTSVVASVTPFYDDNGSLIGITSCSCDSRSFRQSEFAFSPQRQPEAFASLFIESSNEMRLSLRTPEKRVKLGLDPQQPPQTGIASKISFLVSKVSNKVKSKIRTSKNCVDRSDHKDDAASGGACTPRGDIQSSHLGVFYPPDHKSMVKNIRDCGDESEGKPAGQKIMTLMAKKGLSWSWKGDDLEESEAKPTRSVWPWAGNDQENEAFLLKSPYSGTKSKCHIEECNRPINYEASGSTSSCSANVSSTSSYSSSWSTSSSPPVNRVDVDTDCSDYEILWEELRIAEQIGQGACGTVYHALWYGSVCSHAPFTALIIQSISCPADVAVKIFPNIEYADDVIHSFKQEVSLMKRLRHPNILLFMGAVTTPQRLCIVTEFLSRGSLFHLLQKNAAKLEWRRRVHMALDIARGMNYLHHYNPPIVHRDLKSSNLLVDKNWTVKVCDFGLSRLKHATYLTTKTGKGTPQWMAPEVLRNEPSNEKSDIYSFGVVLWELATGKIPWDGLNSMQVIATVGFMNQRLEIPKEIDPRWASIIESCWHSEPQCRPSFREVLGEFRDLERQSRKLGGDGSQKGLFHFSWQKL